MRSGSGRKEVIKDDGHQITGQHDDPAGPSTSGEPWSRREFLGAGAVAAVGLVTPGALWLPQAGAVAAASPFTGTNALRLAMHVHASWSEGLASWEAQFTQAAATAIDVLYMTDHDFRSTATNFITSLPDTTKFVRSTTGQLAQQASTVSAGGFHVLAESSSTTAAASVTLALQPKPLAFNRVRTSIAGQTLQHTVTAATLSGGATYEVAVQLSYHPAVTGRPAGNYQLIYRFGAFTASRFTENGGLTGVVSAPTPAAGSVQRLSPETDVAAIWPSMLAMDNAMYGVSFAAISPHKGSVANVTVSGVAFLRTQNSPASVTANQARLISTYQPRFPNLTVRPTIEIGEPLPHMNPFGIPQYFPDYAHLPTNSDLLFEAIVADVHSKQGLISLNHPFGFNDGPLLAAAGRTTKRHQVWASLQGVHDYGVDILEVGYALRGSVDAATHIALFDTFARNGTFLTANGTNDDHGGKNWKGLNNGFFTGVWAASRSEADILAALTAGRAYAAHLGLWPGGETDLLVDGAVRMGSVSVATKATRSMAIWAANLPAGSSVQLVAGPVDFAGAQDPGTTVVNTLATTAFSGGVATVTVDTSVSRFYRVQVLAKDGTLIGCGNPVWLLRAAPPGGIPPARA
jgi:hypothetical protein